MKLALFLTLMLMPVGFASAEGEPSGTAESAPSEPEGETTGRAATKEAWKESGRSWKGGFRELGDALGKSIRGEAGLKEEWKDVGRGFGDAGKDTGGAVVETFDGK